MGPPVGRGRPPGLGNHQGAFATLLQSGSVGGRGGAGQRCAARHPGVPGGTARLLREEAGPLVAAAIMIGFAVGSGPLDESAPATGTFATAPAESKRIAPGRQLGWAIFSPAHTRNIASARLERARFRSPRYEVVNRGLISMTWSLLACSPRTRSTPT